MAVTRRHGSDWQQDPKCHSTSLPISPAAGARQPPCLDPRRGPGAELGLLLRVGARAVLPAGQGVRRLPHPLLPGLPLRGPAHRVQGDPSLHHLTGPAAGRRCTSIPWLSLCLPVGSGPRCPLSLVPATGGRGHLNPNRAAAAACGRHHVPSPAFAFCGQQGLVGCDLGKEKELLVISYLLSLLCLILTPGGSEQE